MIFGTPSSNFQFGITCLLWWDIKGHSSEIHTLVGVNAGYHCEDSRALGTSFAKPAKTENHRSLILSDHLEQMIDKDYANYLIKLSMEQIMFVSG